MIFCKRINDLAIVVVNGKIYNRAEVTDSIWIEILETVENYRQECTDASFEKMLDIIDISRVKQREEEAKVKEQILKDAQLDLDFNTRIRKAKRIADISGLFEYDEDCITYLKGFKHPMPKILVEALLDAH